MSEHLDENEDNEILKNALGQALPGTNPDPGLVASHAAARGRVIRRRRSLLQVGGSVAVVAVVAVGSVAASSAFGHSGGGAGTAIAPGGGVGGAASASESATGPLQTPTGALSSSPDPAMSSTSDDTIIDPGTHPGNNHQWGSGGTLPKAAKTVPYSDLLMSLIPSGFTKTNTRLNPVGSQDGRTVIDDGKGASLLKVVAQYLPTAPQQDMTDCTNGSGNGTGTKPDECHHSTTADGTKVLAMIVDGANDAQQQGVKYWDVEVQFKDGVFVGLSERNTDADGDPKTRDVAPLSLDQLTAIATDPKWDTLGMTNVRNQ